MTRRKYAKNAAKMREAKKTRRREIHWDSICFLSSLLRPLLPIVKSANGRTALRYARSDVLHCRDSRTPPENLTHAEKFPRQFSVVLNNRSSPELPMEALAFRLSSPKSISYISSSYIEHFNNGTITSRNVSFCSTLIRLRILGTKCCRLRTKKADES